MLGNRNKLVVLAITILIWNIYPVFASNDIVSVAIDSPTQVKPGTSIPVYITVFNIGEISIPVSSMQSPSIEGLPDINSLKTKSTSNKVTVEEIVVLKPLNLKLNDSILSQQLPAQFKKLSPNEVITSAGDAVIAKEMLEDAYQSEIKRLELSNITEDERTQKLKELIEEYGYKKAVLDEIISGGKYHTLLLVKIPANAEEGDIKVPVEVTYTVDKGGSITTETFTKTLDVTVTNTIEPRRAIIIGIDALKRDTLYDSNGNYNSIVSSS